MVVTEVLFQSDHFPLSFLIRKVRKGKIDSIAKEQKELEN